MDFFSVFCQVVPQDLELEQEGKPKNQMEKRLLKDRPLWQRSDLEHDTEKDQENWVEIPGSSHRLVLHPRAFFTRCPFLLSKKKKEKKHYCVLFLGNERTHSGTD